MARKRLENEHDDNGRWLISYADLMTSMFAFFVMLYAVSSIQDMKNKALSSSLDNNSTMTKQIPDPNIPTLLEFKPLPSILLAPETPPALIKPELPPIQITPDPVLTPISEATPQLSEEELRLQEKLKQEKAQMQSIVTELEQRLAPLVSQNKVRIMLSNWGISIEINASILFAAAEAKLDPNAFGTLRSIAEVLKDQPQAIHVAGHTDDKAINTPYFPSNWELSSARAGSVVRLLIDAGINGKRLAAIGYADNQPVASNTTSEGRLRNRRVQLSIMTQSAEEFGSSH